MLTVYVYAPDTLADWEIGYVTAELNSRRFFQKDAPEVSVKTAGIAKEPVKTMGGLTILPDCVIDDIAVSDTSVLLLPGGNTWEDPKHDPVIKKAAELLSRWGCGMRYLRRDGCAGPRRSAGSPAAHKQRRRVSRHVLPQLQGAKVLCG